MRVFRARSSVITSVALSWQLLAVMFVPTALCCLSGAAAQATGQSESAMADCPIHHDASPAVDPACPLHAGPGAILDCDCPRLGCSQTDNGFMARFGPIGVLTAPASIPEPHLAGNAVLVISPSSVNLAPVPVAPPPRS